MLNIIIIKKASDGGQKGLRSIIEALSSEDFPRVRVGVGSKPEGWDLKNFVLSRFTEEENDGIIKGITDAGASVVSIVEGKTLDAMNMYNKKNRPV